MGAMLKGNLPDIDPAESDAASERQGLGTDQQRPSERRNSQTDYTPRQGRRGPRSVLARALKRLWIPLVILTVLGVGGFTVAKLHGVFGSDKSLSYGDTKIEDTKPFNPKQLRYEIFGPPGTVADISYFDGDGEPRSVDNASLPWSLEFPITGAAGVGSIAAQGDSDSLGCRILVDEVVKDEKIVTHEVSTFTSCLLKAA